MKIDCPKCGSGVGVLSIREGSAKCPSCAHEFEAGEHIARLSSRRMPTGPPAAPRGAAPGTTTRDESLPQKTAPEASPYEVTPEDVKPTDDTHRIPPPTPSRRKMQLSASSTASSRADVIAALKRVGPYEDIREVARGGMGVVYKAREKRLKRLVAIKVLKGSTDDPEEVRRFRREAEAAARLQHSNIVPIHAVGEVLGRPFFVMDFIEGRVLSELIKSGELSPRAALDVVQQAAGALHYAHSQGVVHRDMKPQNIIVDRLGRPQVMDFGLAKQLDEDAALTRAGTTMGTPAYMPPEQAEGDTAEIDAQSDVYSLGAVLYEMLTGTPPFSGSSTMNILMKVLEEEPTPPREVNPRIHRDIETICLKAMSKEKSRRYATARELAEDIRRFHAGEAISAAPTTLLYKLKRTASRNKGAVAVIVALVLALGALTGWLLGQEDREHRAQVVNQHRHLREMLDRAARAVERARYLREVGEPGWRDRMFEKLDAARVDAEYVLRSLPGDGEAAAVAESAREMKRQLRVDELLGHARDFLKKDQHLAAETFYRIVLEDYDPENAEARKGLKLARGLGRLRVTTVPAGIEATLLPWEAEDGGGRTALGRTPVGRGDAASSGQRRGPDRAASSGQRRGPDRAASSGQRRGPDGSRGVEVPTGLYRLELVSERVGRHEIPVEVGRSGEVDLGSIHLPEQGSRGDGMLLVPDGLVELPGGKRTWVNAFLIDRYESGARLGETPRLGMSWVEASAACAEKGKRLCGLAEWRRACSGPERLAFPYGAAFDPGRCWTGRTKGPGPAGGRPGCVSRWGVYDMSGNVAEWVGRDETRATTYGGDWSTREGALLGCGSDFYRPPHERATRAGFRCCRGAGE